MSAAASLSDVLRELGAAYEKTSGDRIVLNFGASSILARQIEAGAPADLFVSADELRMDQLARRGLIVPATRRNLVANTLAIVVPFNARPFRSPRELLGVKRLALAQPESVPAGIYAKAWLTKKGLWTALAPRVIPTENVRAALAAVEAGNVDAAIVYRTDALISPRVRVAWHVPRADGPRIVYPAAVLRDAARPAHARRFLDFLASPRAARVFAKHGFGSAGVPPAGPAASRRRAEPDGR